MKIVFSANQKKAIETPGHVIVSAGAGSGKTAVMIERIVNKLANGSKLDEMLIVTFTRAAAADMRAKLALRLTELKRGGDARSARMATEALYALPVCNIGTLHSFCQRLIRTYFYAAEIDPASNVLDESDAAKYKLMSIASAVREAREHPTLEFEAVEAALSSRRSDDGLIQAVRTVVEFALSLSEPDAFLDGTRPDSYYFGALDAAIETERDALAAEAELLLADVTAAGFTKIYQAASDLVPYLDGLIDDVTKTRVTATGGATDLLNDRLKELKAACKAHREKAAEYARAKTVDSAPYAEVLCALAKTALIKYAAVKSALGRIDYSDLEHGALKVLRDEKCVSEISSRLKYVFIDEYQDVNPLQAEIAYSLKSGAGAEMFLVGDIKQSIYAFRRCDPKYFKDAMTDPEYTKVALNDNYRSSRAVVEFINKVFTGVMRDDFGGADYDDNKLVYGKKSRDEGFAEFVLVEDDERDKPDSGASETAGSNAATEGDSEKYDYSIDGVAPTYSVVESAAASVSAPDPQARFIVDSILEYVDGGSDAAPRTFGSVAVLLRSGRTAFCDELVAYMRACGVPCRLGRNSAIGDYPEAAALLNILRYIDNRFDDIALYTALRSPMGGFSDAELLAVAEEGEAAAKRNGVAPEYGAQRKSYCFRQKVDSYDGALKDRIDAFKKLRETFTEYAADHDAADVIGAVTSGIDYFGHVFEMGGNAAVIDAMIEDAAARKLDLCSYLSAVNESTELAVADGGDAVTVSTVHASKGLEYDYVIVADIGHGFMMREASAPYIVTGDGVAVKYPDEKARKLVPSAPWLAASAALPPHIREEELRLFYVALTRAKQRLTVCGKSGVRQRPIASASCEYDYMQNVLPRVVTAGSRIQEPVSEPRPIDARITAAVKAACETEYAYPSLAVKTCVTALGESGVEAVFAVTDDDKAALYDNADETPTGVPVYAVTADERAAGSASPSSSADAKLRGTAYHRAMELCDFARPDAEAIKAECENFELVDFDKIVKAAECMSKLAAGACVFRERPFIVDLPLCEISGGSVPLVSDGSAARGDSVLLQGVIDLLIVRDGEAIIVDYKTSSPETLGCSAYRTQLALYKKAVEKATAGSKTPLSVTKTYLYSFVLGKAIEVIL